MRKPAVAQVGGDGRREDADAGVVLVAVLAIATVAVAAGLVVQRQHLVAFRFRPPQVDHLAEALGLGRREVGGLREVLRHVVQLPRVVIEGARRVAALVGEPEHRVERDRLPSVVVDRPAPEHLVVLGGVGARRVRVDERGAEAHPVERSLLDTAEVRRRRRCR